MKFKPGVSDQRITAINLRHATSVLYTSAYAGFRLISVPPDKTVPEMVALYSRDPNVEYAEPNYIVHAHWAPNDEYYPLQWHLDNPVYGGINMEAAWDIETGDPSVVVAVIDTGVAYEDYMDYYLAPDLAQTSFVPGYDFVNNDIHPNDDHSHGTHVAGTIAQSTNNGIGVAGVAFGSSIMPIKVLDGNGDGTIADEADGILWATDHGADVINLSLGGLAYSTAVENAVAYAYNHGVTIVASAGNEGAEPNRPMYPAAYDDYVIAVGATRYDEARAPYSNTGSYLDLTAPGGDRNEDQNDDGYADGVLQQTFNRITKDASDFGYWFFEGTSMSAPHVSGVAALLISQGTAITPDDVRQALQSTAEDQGTLGWDEEYGWGIVDAYAALMWTPPYAVEMTATPAEQTVTTGEDAVYTVTIENTGTTDDTYDLEVSANEADFGELSQATVAVAAGASTDVDLTIRDSTEGSYLTTVEAVSRGNPTVSDDATVTTYVIAGVQATRDLPEEANTGETFTVSIDIVNLQFGQLVETLPGSFTYVSCAPGDGMEGVSSSEVEGVVTFTFLASTGAGGSFSYDVSAPDVEGVYTFDGILRGLGLVEYAVGGDTEVTVGWTPWAYDTNDNGVIDIGEVLAAVVDYFDEVINISQVLDVIVLYFSA